MSTTKNINQFDLRDLPASFYQNPFPFYAELRAREPVFLMPDGSYFLTRYKDCLSVYRDTKVFSSDKTAEFLPKYGKTALYEHHTTSLVFNDPPLHTRVRRLIMRALSSRAMALLEAQVVALVGRLLDDLENKSEIDFVHDFAAAIPVDVIGNLLAIPYEDRTPLRGWSLAILGALEPQLTPLQHSQGNAAVEDFLAYLKALVEDRRARPGNPDEDLLTRLIQGEGDGARLSESELLHNCIFILNAGHETTTNLISSAIVLLERNRTCRAQLLAAPELIGSAIEECLRLESPNQLGNRIARQAATLSGIDIPAGSRITICIGAANRDPEAFERPDAFDIKRHPNRHLAFASGAHQCAGMHVARMEARIALQHLLARFPDYRLTAPPVRARRARFRGFDRIKGQV